MRKVFWVLFGLAVLAGAVGLAGYRHWFEPQQRAKYSRSVGEQNRSATTTPRSAPQSAPRSGQANGSAATPVWQSFETWINIANVLVGLVGIWLTISGMRMQRQALAAAARQER